MLFNAMTRGNEGPQLFIHTCVCFGLARKPERPKNMGKKSKKKAGKAIASSIADPDETAVKVDVKPDVQCSEISSSSNIKKKKNKKMKKRSLEEPNQIEQPSKKVKKEEVKIDLSFVDAQTSRSGCILRFKQDQRWFDVLKSTPGLDHVVSDGEVRKVEEYAERMFNNEVQSFAGTGGSSEKRWMQSVLKSGTLSDKISAYVVMLQESPVHNLQALHSLISMVSVKSRRPCMLAMDALKQLFPNYLLKPGEKLQTFAQHCRQNWSSLNEESSKRDKLLVLWMFEGKLKEMYGEFLDALDQVAKDTLEKSKVQAMSAIVELLIANPEREQTLLSRLVNKLGDPVRGVAAKATYQLAKLLEAHPAMQMIVLQEIEQLLYRSNVSLRAQYYGICCLTQMVLRQGQVANKLITIYFSFFKLHTSKKELDTKLVSALLTGVNRAYPFAKISDNSMEEHLETMFKIIHSTNFNTSVQALMLVYQLVQDSKASGLSDRFYSAFYKKLLDPTLPTSNKQALFLNLTFKALKSDPSDERAACFIRRLLQVSHYLAPHLVCSVFYLISETIKAKPSLKLAFTKAKIEWESDDDEDKEEHYDDVPEEGEEKSSVQTSGSSWVFKDLKPAGKQRSDNKKYNPEHRNPLFGCASQEPVWELASVARQYHPSAALFAQNLLEGKPVSYTGDPLQDFTLMRFLDRFVFRNPKKDPGRGRPNTVFSKRNVYRPTGIKNIAPDSKEYLNKDSDQIPVDEKFIHTYLKAKAKFKADEQDSDAESVNSDDFDAALENAAGFGQDLDFAGAVDQDLIDDDDALSDDEMEDDDDDDSDSENEELPASKKKQTKKSTKKGQLETNQSADSNEELDDFSDEDEPFEEIEDFDALSEDEIDVDKSDSELEELPASKKKQNKNKKKSAKDRKLEKLQKLSSDPNLMASAEEFADLIDEYDQNDDLGHGTLDDVQNTNKSSVKQLKWEKQRHHDQFARKPKKFKQNKFSKKMGNRSKSKRK